MMYLVFNEDGSIKHQKLNEFIQQGSSYTNVLFVAIENVLPSAYTLTANFVLPNGKPSQVISLEQTGTEEIGDVEYNGQYLSLSSDQTQLEGALRVNIQALQVGTEKVLVSTSTYLTVNEGVSPSDPVLMTETEYRNLIRAIGVNVVRSQTIYKANQLSDLGLVNTWEDGQTFYIKNTNRLYVANRTTNNYDILNDFNDFVSISKGTFDAPEKITGYKWFSHAILLGTGATKPNTYIGGNSDNNRIDIHIPNRQYIFDEIAFSAPTGADLGKSNRIWRDLYLSRNLTDGTNSVAISNIARKDIEIADLQEQIDTITSKSDVVDVVALYDRGTDTTKTDLVHYDTSKLFENDIIKVLIDNNPSTEQQDDIAYYKYVATGGAYISGKFNRIGSIEPYYTKSETDALLAEKADSEDLETLEQTVEGKSTVSGTVGDDSKWNTLTIDGTTHDLGGSGGGGTEYIAGTGIVIEDDEISIDGEVVATKEDLTNYETSEHAEETFATKTELTGKENTSNKISSLTDATDNVKYLGAKVVADELKNVREVAEGKCKTIVVAYSGECSLEQMKINLEDNPDGAKAYLMYEDGTKDDISQAVLDGDYDDKILNPIFNSQSGSITLAEGGTEKYLVLYSFSFASTTQYEINYYFYVNKPNYPETGKKQKYAFDDLNTGDIILVEETDVPDRWLQITENYAGTGIDIVSAFKLETSKVDLTNYVDLSSAQTITGFKQFNNGVIIPSGQKVGNDRAFLQFASNTVSYWRVNASSGLSLYSTAVIPTGNGVYELGGATNKFKEAFINKLTGATQSANTDDIINGTFNVINASDITSNTLTQAQYDLITNGKPTLIKGTLLNKENIYLVDTFALNSGGYNLMLGYTKEANGRIAIIVLRINISTKVLTIGDNPACFSFLGKNIPAYPSSPTNDMALVYGTDNALHYYAKGNTITSTSTTPSLALASGNEYQFSNALTSLTIASLDTTEGDKLPRWEVSFTAGSGFTLTLPTGITWKYGLPQWEQGEQYTVYIKGTFAYLC